MIISIGGALSSTILIWPQNGHGCQDQSWQHFLCIFQKVSSTEWLGILDWNPDPDEVGISSAAGNDFSAPTRLKCLHHLPLLLCTKNPSPSEVHASKELLSRSIPAFPHNFWRQKRMTFHQARIPSSAFTGAWLAPSLHQWFFHRVNDFGKLWKALAQREQCRTKFMPVGVRSLMRLAWQQLSQKKGIHPTPEKGKKPNHQTPDPFLWKVTEI